MLTILSDREAHQLASYVTEMNTALSNIMVIIAAAQTVQVSDEPVHKSGVVAANTSATKVKTKTIKSHRKTRNTLNEKKVLEIKRRLAQGEKAASICRDFRVHVTTINSIKYGKTWQHVQLHQVAEA